ncbi:MAG: ABC transporter permease [SAR324 cluster bacterium]|nr:ABC transporter permease [SAR324 cluster bacterium]
MGDPGQPLGQLGFQQRSQLLAPRLIDGFQEPWIAGTAPILDVKVPGDPLFVGVPLSWRLPVFLLLFLAILPVALAALISAVLGEDETSNREFINTLLDGLLIAGILPLVMMVLATTAFGNELEDRTLSFLVLKPVPRYLIVLPKLLASVIVGGSILIASGVAATLLGASGVGAVLVVIDGQIQAVAAVSLALLAGVITYAAIFTWAGLITTRALAFALIYVFLWEGLVSSLLTGARYLSVRGYTLGILHGIDDQSFETLGERVIEFPVAIVGAVVVSAVFFWLTVRRLRSMDVP